MAKIGNLVSEHMEGLSPELLERFQTLMRAYIHGKHGIYVLYHRNELYYVGLANNLRHRLGQHLRDRHKGLWDRFSVYFVTEVDHIRELESLILRIVKPKGNLQVGRIPGSLNLGKQLTRTIRDHQKKELDQLVLGTKPRPIRQREEKKPIPKQEKGHPPLKGLVRNRLVLRGIRNGKPHKATAHKAGWIDLNGQRYNSPSAAAAKICGHAMNGWRFWRYRDGSGEWVPIEGLRKMKVSAKRRA